MSPISENNKKLLEKKEAQLVAHRLWLVKDGLNRSFELVTNARLLKQFVIGLSTAILGVVFPSLISKQPLVGLDYFLLAFISFGVVVVWGLLSLIVPTLQERAGMRAVSEHHVEQTGILIEKIQQIKKMEDDTLAGKEFETLQQTYQTLDLGEPGSILKLFYRFEDTFFYALFIVAFILLVIGIFTNLSFY